MVRSKVATKSPKSPALSVSSDDDDFTTKQPGCRRPAASSIAAQELPPPVPRSARPLVSPFEQTAFSALGADILQDEEALELLVENNYYKDVDFNSIHHSPDLTDKHDEWAVEGAREVGLEHNLCTAEEEEEAEADAVKLEQVTPYANASHSCTLRPRTVCFHLSRLCYGVCCAEHLPRHLQCSFANCQ